MDVLVNEIMKVKSTLQLRLRGANLSFAQIANSRERDAGSHHNVGYRTFE